MRYHFAWVVVVLALAEAGYFYWHNQDVVVLNRSAQVLAVDREFPATARRVLARERVTRRVLERISDAAARRGDRDLQIAAIERIARQSPDDREVRLRLAEALREAGRLAEAEPVYRSLVGLPPAPEAR